MTDDNTASSAAGRPATGTSSSFSAPPPGHGLRRAMTVSVAEDAASRRQHMSPPGFDTIPPRRSSNFSEYSLSEARDLLNPQLRDPSSTESSPGETSSLASLSLAFALLPAISGVLFKNGNAVVTDVMLLGLAGVFLHWSVTQPWAWYHSAQEVRIQHESTTDSVIDDDSDLDSSTHMPAPHSPLDHVPEYQEVQTEPTEELQDTKPSNQQQEALAELYYYEIIALASCFILPLLGAYLLHAIRSQLSRPSEGLVSNYNLTIFLLVAELRYKEDHPDSRKVVRIRDNWNPYSRGWNDSSHVSQQKKPFLAVRRYEKKATLLQFQTESRFSGVDARLDDAIALAASAAKNSASHKNMFMWTVESLTVIILLPFKTLLRIMLLPLSTLLALTSKSKKKSPPSSKMSRSSRNGKASVQPRYNGDRVPSRVAKR
ncbi:hypothetical protein FoTM2_003566 [Fusarium oxysporum f. sp. vasinfectum]|nr:hypothetical protein FoTM2_003566 [Fusarium oxysporum f. sp. vasinfectum]WKT42698.1 hypothetical protein QSH57_007534 [Fusarium oxysporum f. sp. vasinfectum]